jgi:hypothetical protein
MTTTEFFEDLLDRINLKIDDKERDFIEEKQNALRDALREKLPLKDDFLTGSYKRHTIIKPLKDGEKFDVDVFLAFDNEEYGERELADLRKMVADALVEIKAENTKLGITDINDTQRRSVCVQFGNNFQIDVVPAIEVEKDVRYKIFDNQTLKAVKSNPKLHAQLLSEANDRTGGKLVPTIKMLKSWKRDKCDYMKSFHLELLAVDILGGKEIPSYPESVAKFFAEAKLKLKESCLKDPANSEYFIDAYLDDDGTRQKLLDLVVAESEAANDALEMEKDEDAVGRWKDIFENSDLETAEAIRSGGFYPGSGGVRVGANNSNDGRISSPRSWGESN